MIKQSDVTEYVGNTLNRYCKLLLLYCFFNNRSVVINNLNTFLRGEKTVTHILLLSRYTVLSAGEKLYLVVVETLL